VLEPESYVAEKKISLDTSCDDKDEEMIAGLE
jgi:hypothetical protein